MVIVSASDRGVSLVTIHGLISIYCLRVDARHQGDEANAPSAVEIWAGVGPNRRSGTAGKSLIFAFDRENVRQNEHRSKLGK